MTMLKLISWNRCAVQKEMSIGLYLVWQLPLL